MARPLRIEFEGVFYHVTSRGNAKSEIYLSDEARTVFLEVPEKTRSKSMGKAY